MVFTLVRRMKLHMMAVVHVSITQELQRLFLDFSANEVEQLLRPSIMYKMNRSRAMIHVSQCIEGLVPFVAHNHQVFFLNHCLLVS